MLIITLLFSVGICLELYFNIALFLIFLVIIYFLIKKKKEKYLIICLLGFLLATLVNFRFNKTYKIIQKLNEEKIKVVAEVLSSKEEGQSKNKYIVQIKKSKFNIQNKKFVIRVKKDKKIEYGDILVIEGSLENFKVDRNYKGFNYQRYLRQKYIYGNINVQKVQKIGKNKSINFYIENLRNKCKFKIEENFNPKEAQFLKGILLGITCDISKSLKQEFQKSNLAHVLAISGMHVNYIVLAVSFILNKIIPSKKCKDGILILFLCFFIQFTGGAISCIRACIMTIVLIFSKFIYRKYDFYSSLMFSFLIILILNPYNIESVGLWLTYLGAFSMYTFRRKTKFQNRFLEYLVNNLFISVSVQIMILPVTIYFFNSVSLIFFVANLFVSNVIGIILILGYVSIFLSRIKIIISLEKFLIGFLFKVVEIVSSFKISKVLVPSINIFEVFIYYLILYLIINREKYFPKIKEIFKKYYMILACLIVVILVFNFIGNFNNKLEIHCVDIGQGDCTFLILPNKKTMIIDGGDIKGGFDNGEKVVAPYLLDKKIKKIDYMFVSHFDSDHVGGLLYLLENFEVGKVYIGIQEDEYKNYLRFMEVIKKNNHNLEVLEKGDLLKLDKNLYLDVLAPDRNKLIKDNGINNNSLVFNLKYKNFSMLFTGDIEKEAEDIIIDNYKDTNKLEALILKSPHHGSRTSSTQGLLDLVKPKIVFVEVGVKNKHKHPSPEIIKRYEDNNFKIFRTDLCGEITLTTNGYNYKIKTHLK